MLFIFIKEMIVLMLTKEVEVKWNSKNKKHFVDLGYTYTKMKDSFIVKVEDLSHASNVRVKVECDYCHEPYDVIWWSYVKLKKKDNNTDCCNKPECTTKKAHESLIQKYGTAKIFKIDKIKQKIKQTNIKKYGVENPFASKEIISKIRKTNIERYGVPVPTQNPEVKEKSKRTCINRYGVSNYGALYSAQHKKELSPSWKGGVSYHRIERSTFEYREWRNSVFGRDMYTCQCCKIKSGCGKKVELQAHHIRNWKDNIDFRYDINNGITLCDKCHTLFHSQYGKKNNDLEQLNEFLSIYNNVDKKIC